jgi:acetyltransferase-like isoleucine patch superfamily enzyme
VFELIKRIIIAGAYAASVLRAIVRGTWYILYFRTASRNVRIGFPFKAFAPVIIDGPGTVTLGKNCAALPNVFRGLTIVTLSENARVSIGNNGHLGGLTIRCRNSVIIGDRVMTAVSLIQDDFIVNRDEADKRLRHDRIKSGAVVLGNNVWLGGDSILLPGAKIGDDDVVAAGTCCSDIEVPQYHLLSGNFAKRPLPIDRLLKLKGVA